jgi:hypothetical protein
MVTLTDENPVAARPAFPQVNALVRIEIFKFRLGN